MLKPGWADEYGDQLDERGNYVPRPNPPGLWRRSKSKDADAGKKGAAKAGRTKRFNAVVGKR